MSLDYNLRDYLIRKGMKGHDELVDTIIDNPSGPEALLYKKCKDINGNKVKRRYVEASLLATSDHDKIADLLEIDVSLINMYNKLFYDVHNLDRISKIELLEKPRERDETIMKTWALHQGIDFIAWRLGKIKQVDINPQEGLTDLFNMAIYKSKEALFNANSTNASIESTRWTRLAVEIARLLKAWIIDSTSAQKDLELAIKEVVPDFKSLDDLIKDPDLVLETKEYEHKDDLDDGKQDDENDDGTDERPA